LLQIVTLLQPFKIKDFSETKQNTIVTNCYKIINPLLQIVTHNYLIINLVTM